MTLWNPDNNREIATVHNGELPKFDPVEVLFEYGEPLAFSLRGDNGDLFLAYLCDESDSAPHKRRYAVAVTNQSILDQLKSGAVNIFAALDQPRTWLADVVETKVVSCWRCTLNQLPDDYLPDPSVPLLPEHEPLLKLRAVGKKIVRGRIPVGAVRHLSTAIQTAYRGLVDHVLERSQTGGRIPNAVKQFSALEIQSFTFNSFEIAFRNPIHSHDMLCDDYAREETKPFWDATDLLASGLKLMQDGVLESLNSEDRKPILEALKVLTPSSISPIEKIEIGGSLWNEAPIELTQDSRKRIGEWIKSCKQPELTPVMQTGLIRQLDKDSLTCSLRQIEPAGGELKCRFEEDNLDMISSACDQDTRVTVVGTQSPNTLIATIHAITIAKPSS